MDETCIQVKGRWTYFYSAVDKFGKTLDFMLSEHRDEVAASAFFARMIENNGWPEKVVIDKSGTNLAGLQNMNWMLLLPGWFWLIEQDHRFIKKLTRPMKGFKFFQSASATLDGIEVARMIRKRQFSTNGQFALKQFTALAA
jgi:putative transposase